MSWTRASAWADFFSLETLGRSEAYDAVVQPDGNIVVVGKAGSLEADTVVLRLKAEGSLDTSFGEGGVVTAPPR